MKPTTPILLAALLLLVPPALAEGPSTTYVKDRYFDLIMEVPVDRLDLATGCQGGEFASDAAARWFVGGRLDLMASLPLRREAILLYVQVFVATLAFLALYLVARELDLITRPKPGGVSAAKGEKGGR